MMTRRRVLGWGGAAILAVAGAVVARVGWQKRQITLAEALFKRRIVPPEGPLTVFHLGHSLVGRDMPAMLAQLAATGHEYASQLGWGAPLRSHYEPDVPINGFDTENAHDHYRPAREALETGDYSALVITEMVELNDAIRYHDSAEYLARWAELARAARSDVRLYLYETWHHTSDPAGWYQRIDSDYDALWLNKLALPASLQIGAPIYVIPGGQALAAVGRALDAAGGIGNLANRDALMARTPEGAVDTIHLSDIGNYVIALTHYATIYQRNPQGLPFALLRADGSAADSPDADAAALIQQTVWDTVLRTRTYSGVDV